MVALRRLGEGFVGIEWKLLRQHLSSWDRRYYDVLRVEISGFLQRDWASLGALQPEQREKMNIRFVREFWFDITSFYGRQVALDEVRQGVLRQHSRGNVPTGGK